MRHYISLGAGVQSSTMALMAAAGEITPMPDGAIFADTQAEPGRVYEWLDWLEQRLPFPVHRVTAGSLTKSALTPHRSKKGRLYYRTVIPFFTRNADGKQGRIPHRTCTRDYKIRPITKALRRLAQVKRGTKHPVVTSWIGISVDEIARMKPSRDPWVAGRWPLIERRMTRDDCLRWMEERGHPRPPRSACVYCPFRSNREWRWLRDHDAEGFAAAVAFDHECRRVRRGTTLTSEAYVHRSLVPLDLADLDAEPAPRATRGGPADGQLSLWQDECSGMCGV